MAAARQPRKEVRIQSLARASAILDVIAENGTVQLTELSAAVGLNKSTTFYLVESLADLGFAERAGDGKGYRLGLRNLELGRSVQRRLDIAAVSRPALMRLCALSKETVNLAVPYVFDAMIVESLEGAHGVRATSYAGSRASYHSTACGKAIVALLDSNVRDVIFAARPLTPVTPNTITRRDLLEAQLAEVRQRGFSLDMEENELGAHCVAAPIRDGLGDVAGAISISGLAARVPEASLIELAQAIMKETRLISKALGADAKVGGEIPTTPEPQPDARRAGAPSEGIARRA